MGKRIDTSKPENNAFALAPAKRSLTQRHRPIVWENMLGTVYADGPDGRRYFDYDYAAAHEYAGTFTRYTDLRVGKVKYDTFEGPRAGRWALFGVKRD